LRSALALGLCLLAAVGSSGCVARRLIIHSSPPGALVYIDDKEIGTTPLAVNYIYYGTRKIRLVKDGYETLTVLEPIPAPWWDHFPLDFVSENLVPGELRDVRPLHYQLVPQAYVPSQELLGRGEELRRAGRGTPPPAAMPAVSELQPGPGAYGAAPAGQVPLPGAGSPLAPGAAAPSGRPSAVEYLPPGQ
jgi:hypothetical protein